MTPVPTPHNATPQKLQLKPPKIPRLPFSSPMGEEILSPTSDPSHTPPQEQRENRNSRGMAGAVHRTPSGVTERALPTPKSQKRESRKDSPNRAKLAGLNVITDFSRGIDKMVGVPQSQTQSKAQLQPLRTKEKRPAQDQALRPNPERRKGSEESVTVRPDQKLGHKRSGRSLKGSGSKGRLDDLKRSSTKSSNLSPSDRAVMIGIAMNPDDIRTTESPGEETHHISSQTAHVRRPSLTPSVAPSIVITPANRNAQAPWSASDKDQVSPPHRRAASSVYSAFPGLREMQNGASMIPPVPPIPEKAGKSRDHASSPEKGKSRAVSAYTIFDEEPSPELEAHSRPASQESQRHMLEKVNSQDTVAAKRTSDGWWTYIKSPFFPKSPMFFKNYVGSPSTEKPASPRQESRGLRKRTPPGSPLQNRKSQAAESAHTSWTDSSIDAENEKRAIEFGGPIEAPRSFDTDGHAQMPRESYHIAQGFRSKGAASEYYEACLFDMHSPEPYFECQNHKCWPSTLGIGGYVSRGTEGPELPPAVRGLALEPMHLDNDKIAHGAGNVATPSQTPKNRFSAAFGKVVDKPDTRAKHLTDVTIIEDVDATPDVREAEAAPIVKANPPKAPVTLPVRKDSLVRQASTIHSSPFFNRPEPQPKVLPTPPPRIPEKNSPRPDADREIKARTPKKSIVSGLPSNPRHRTLNQPLSPQPLTPGANRQAPHGAIALHEVHESREADDPLHNAPQHTYITNHHYHAPPSKRSSHVSQTTVRDLWPPPRPPRPVESLRSWNTKETYNPPPKKPIKKNSFNFDHYTKCLQRKPRNGQRSTQSADKKKRKRILIVIGVALLLLVILVMVLAMTLTRRGDKMSAESQWLNITGYPPIPTGISTIAQPEAAYEEPGCVQPKSMWSCALPKEEQQDAAPNAPNEPNFRVEIRFQNGTNVSQPSSANLTSRSLHQPNAISASHLIRTKLLQIRSTFTNSLFTSDPAPPSREDQSFLGNTTEKNQQPFDGEFTPFYMTFHSPAALAGNNHLLKRDVLPTSSSSDSDDDSNNSTFPDIASAIPPASVNPDGTASPALLYPYPSAQPLRLFNRGRPDEHYGFYTYFSRSIFLKSVAPLNASIVTGNSPPEEPADKDGGSKQEEASVRCTWAETRFLVQVWTNKGDNFALLNKTGTAKNGGKNSDDDNDDNNDKGSQNKQNATTSSANDFTRPGSFPYPVSITLDRHGGDIKKKMIYCYGLDNNAKPISNARKLQLEDREFGGRLVNGAKGPWKDVTIKSEDGGPGGMDGGSGGCGCRWENFKK